MTSSSFLSRRAVESLRSVAGLALAVLAALAVAVAAPRSGGEATGRGLTAGDGRGFFENRSYVTYTVEQPEALPAVLRRCGLRLKPEVVRRLNPRLPSGDSFPSGTKLTLFIQAPR